LSGAEAVNPRNVAEIVVAPMPESGATTMGNTHGVVMPNSPAEPHGVMTQADAVVAARTIPGLLDERITANGSS
jgi:hypothetical protein